MPNEEYGTSLTGGDPSRRLLLPGALIVLVVVGLALLVIIREDERPAIPPRTSSQATTPSTATSIPDSRRGVIARLQEILQIREQALRDRNANLFDDVYTTDCSCLKAGRVAVAALKRENVIWRNRSISINVQSAKELSNRLWEVVAIFISDSFRIETEEGNLVREAPAERIRYRFLLVRASESEPWRLGSASPIEAR
jgi:hypothetical protein